MLGTVLILSPTTYVIAFHAVALLVLCCCWSQWSFRLKYKNLPPGPFCWPILGYLPIYSRKTNYQKLREAGNKYGSVFSIFIGRRFAVVVNDFEVSKDAFNREEFLGRDPKLLSLSPDPHVTSITQMNGQTWKTHRKFWQNSIRHVSASNDGFRSSLKNTIPLILNDLKERQSEEINLEYLFHELTSNAAFYLIFGRTFDKGHELFKQLQDYSDAMKLILPIHAVAFFFNLPDGFGRLIPKVRHAKKIIQRFENAIRKEIRDHQQTLEPNDPRDFIDHFLIQMQKTDLEEIYNTSTLLGDILLQCVQFSETVSLTINWFLLYMAAHPETQKKLQKAIDSIIGREREPLLTDRPSLPLLDAAILESMRLRPVFHLNVFRCTLKDTKLCGYDIPGGTVIVHSDTSHFMDHKYWTNPDQFDPARFLTECKTRLQIPDFFLPFSFGKRACLGEGYATSTMFLFAASVLQRFNVLPPDGGTNLDINVTVANFPAHPFVKFQCR